MLLKWFLRTVILTIPELKVKEEFFLLGNSSVLQVSSVHPSEFAIQFVENLIEYFSSHNIYLSLSP